MTGKYTSAPWQVVQKEYIHDEKGYLIAKVLTHKTNTLSNIMVKDLKANAHLIAAAPELLAALERCYDVFNMDEVDTAISLQVGMAISRAKGELK